MHTVKKSNAVKWYIKIGGSLDKNGKNNTNKNSLNRHLQFLS